MNVVDIIIILIILMCGVVGFKKGVIKSLVELVGMIAVVILSYILKDYLADFLMKHLPFFEFKGALEGLSGMNILIYKVVSFLFIFIIGYCILNILIQLSGIVEKILKYTVILAIPSKILGGILGLLEGVVISFVLSYVCLHLPQTEKYIRDSKLAIVLLERTPYVGPVIANTTLALENIDKIIEDNVNTKNRKDIDVKIVQELIRYQIIDKDKANELIKDKKLRLENVQFG